MQIQSDKQMFDLGKKISLQNSKVLLYGELGAGKTIFVKGFAYGLGIDPDTVKSPTYTYLNEYDEKLLHIDMYRLETEKQFMEKLILEKIQQYDNICIEWPKFEDYYIDHQRCKIEIIKLDEYTREIEM